MVFVEDLADVAEVEVVLGPGLPGQVDEPLQVLGDDDGLGRQGHHLAEAPVLAEGDLLDLGGHAGLEDVAAEVVEVGPAARAPGPGAAEFLLDGLELLLEEVLLLGLADAAADAVGDLLLELQQVDLVLQQGRQRLQPLVRVQHLQQPLLVGEGDGGVGGHGVGEDRAGVELGGQLADALRQVRVELKVREEAGLDGPGEGLGLVALEGGLVQGVGVGPEAAVGAADVGDADAAGGLDDDLVRAALAPHALEDGRRHAHLVEVRRPRVGPVRVLLGDQDEGLLGIEGGVDGGDGGLAADAQRHDDAGERDRPAQGEDRQAPGRRRLGLVRGHRRAPSVCAARGAGHSAGTGSATASAGGASSSRPCSCRSANRTLTLRDTPGSCIVTP